MGLTRQCLERMIEAHIGTGRKSDSIGPQPCTPRRIVASPIPNERGDSWRRH